jgi:two-component system, response regulator PdtaR
MILEEISQYQFPPWFLATPNGGPGASEEGSDGSRSVRRLRVLIVEDEFFISLDTQNLLQALGHDVVGIAVTAEEAVQIAGRERPDVVLMDIRLIGPRDGVAAAAEIRSSFGIASIFVTANTDAETKARALQTAPLGFLAKPLTEYRLRIGLAQIDNPKI